MSRYLQCSLKQNLYRNRIRRIILVTLPTPLPPFVYPVFSFFFCSFFCSFFFFFSTLSPFPLPPSSAFVFHLLFSCSGLLINLYSAEITCVSVAKFRWKGDVINCHVSTSGTVEGHLEHHLVTNMEINTTMGYEQCTTLMHLTVSDSLVLRKCFVNRNMDALLRPDEWSYRRPSSSQYRPAVTVISCLSAVYQMGALSQ